MLQYQRSKPVQVSWQSNAAVQRAAAAERSTATLASDPLEHGLDGTRVLNVNLILGLEVAAMLVKAFTILPSGALLGSFHNS